MAKPKKEPQTYDMFPVDPIIRGLGIVDVKLKEGELIIDMRGRTLVSDIACFGQDTWRDAVAEYLVSLCGNADNIIDYVNKARMEAWEREREIEAAMAKEAQTTSMPNGMSLA